MIQAMAFYNAVTAKKKNVLCFLYTVFLCNCERRLKV